MSKSFLLEYCKCNPSFIEELNSLPAQYRIKFMQKFKNERDRIEFLSKISEFRFVQFFLKKGFQLDYEPVIYNKTPDLRITIDNTEIVGDVKRFNISDEDQIKEHFFNNLRKQLQTIKLPYHVYIRQTQYFSFELFDILDIKEQFLSWLKENKVQVGDIFNYHDLFTIEIINLKGIKDYILLYDKLLKNKIHSNKVSSIVKAKVSYYNDDIIKKGYPFFVCVDLILDTLIDPEDFSLKFHGGISLNISTGIESFDLGEFYLNEIYSNVLGILLRYHGNFFWIRNYRQKDFFRFKNIN